MAYYVTWLPYYDRYAVTASADCPDAFGYCDFALGAFGIDTPIKEGARKIICADWSDQHTQGEQQRWAYLFSTELISKQEAEAWAEHVWPSERSGEESLEEEATETGRGESPQDCLQGLRTLRPGIPRRAAELLATSGSDIAQVEGAVAKYG